MGLGSVAVQQVGPLCHLTYWHEISCIPMGMEAATFLGNEPIYQQARLIGVWTKVPNVYFVPRSFF